MSKFLLPLVVLAVLLAWFSSGDEDAQDTGGTAISGTINTRPEHSSAGNSSSPGAALRPLFGSAASPFGKLDCSGHVQTSACNPDEIPEETVPVGTLIQTRASQVARGEYERMPELASNLLECSALARAEKAVNDVMRQAAASERPEVAICDAGVAGSWKSEVKTALLAAARAGNTGARSGYAEYLKLELLEAIAELNRARELGSDPAASTQHVAASKAALREYIGTGALDHDPSKSDYLGLEGLEAEPALD